MYTCAHCTTTACEFAGHDVSRMPKNCPMHDLEKLSGLLDGYKDEKWHDFYTNCSATEAEGYGKWPRLRESAEFCTKMGYKKVGLALCVGGIVMFIGIWVYNFAIRFIPFIIKKLGVLLILIFKLFKNALIKLKALCRKI